VAPALQTISGDTAKLAKPMRLRGEPMARALHDVTAQLAAVDGRMQKIEDQPLSLGTSSVHVAEKARMASCRSRRICSIVPARWKALADAAIRRAQTRPTRHHSGRSPVAG
jgi:hypothetical protein